MKRVVVIGCGAAGMMCAIKLAGEGNRVTVIEKNDKPGKKLFITGKGRCNVTNACDEETFLKNVVSNSKFMYSSIYSFNSNAAMDFFEKLGVKLKVERGNRVFPASDHSSDIIGSLTGEMKRLAVDIIYNTAVSEVLSEDYFDDRYEKKITGVKIIKNNKEEIIYADAVVVATGGVSYPLTGSTGDGYKFAEDLGIAVNKPLPALVPLVSQDEVCKRLMGLSLKNVSVSFEASVKNKKKIIYKEFGEMLFTHFGVSGPLILSASSKLHKYTDSELTMYIDLKPALTEDMLDKRLLRDFSDNINKQLQNAISDILPKSLLPVVIERAGLDPYKKVNEIKKEERESLVRTLKYFKLSISGFRDFSEAIITQGGVSVKEINPKTMESKKVRNLFFVGEVLDVDAYTGGFNLQIAWSTAMSVNL